MSDTENITYTEVINTLKYVKKHQPIKTSTWSTSADEIKLLWFSLSERLLKTTDNGYELTELGEMLLNGRD